MRPGDDSADDDAASARVLFCRGYDAKMVLVRIIEIMCRMVSSDL